MRKKLETGLCVLLSVLCSFYIVLYVLHERELFRALFGSLFISIIIFAFLMWLFEIAKVKDERKKKKKSIDSLSLD